MPYDGVAIERQYFWGPDRSGTLDKACGVGGLVAVSINGTFYFPCYGSNSEIAAYVSESGAVVASYVYGPFGEVNLFSGPMVDQFSFRFMTKRYDAAVGLYDFGGRWYSPVLHRWLNRDPIAERGGLNIYAFCRNDPVNNYDPNGCAYFIKRKLDYLPWIKNFSANANLDGKNLEFVHEHLVYEDDGKSTGVGYFWGSEKREDNNWKNVKWVRVPGWYNDCVMRKAEELVQPKPYNIFTYNCQDYAEDLRKKYNELIRDKKIRCECNVDGRRKH